MMLHALRQRAGFTLIEIMIVIAIIAILAGIVVPNFMQARAEAQLEACKRNILTIANAIEMAIIRCGNSKNLVSAVSTNRWGYNNLSDQVVSNVNVANYLIEHGYLKHFPICPLKGQRSQSNNYYIIMLSRKGAGQIYCSGGHYLGGQGILARYYFGDSTAQKYGWDIIEIPLDDTTT